MYLVLDMYLDTASPHTLALGSSAVVFEEQEAVLTSQSARDLALQDVVLEVPVAADARTRLVVARVAGTTTADEIIDHAHP